MFIHCCLAAPLSVPERLGAGAGGLLGDSAVAGQLQPIHCSHDQLSAHQQHQPQPATVCAMWRTWAHQWWAAEYLSNPAKFKFRDFITEIKQRADLAWSWVSWAVQMEMGTMSWDWNAADVTVKTFKQSCQFHILIIHETTIVLLDSLADSHSNGIKIKFLSEGLPI